VSGGLACVAGALILGALIPALRAASLTSSPSDDEPPGTAEQPAAAPA
jgi:hypothetical protein